MRTSASYRASAPANAAGSPASKKIRVRCGTLIGTCHAGVPVSSATTSATSGKDSDSGPVSGYSRERNILRLSMRGGPLICEPTEDVSRHVTGELRQSAARYPADGELHRLVQEFSAHNSEFAAHRRAHRIDTDQPVPKRIRHPRVGAVDLDVQTLRVPGRDQRVVLLTAVPGSPSAAKLERLRSAAPVAVRSAG